jgi:hypothetical protein
MHADNARVDSRRIDGGDNNLAPSARLDCRDEFHPGIFFWSLLS